MPHRYERLRASAPFLILSLLIAWLGGQLMLAGLSAERHVQQLAGLTTLAPEGAELHQQWAARAELLTESLYPGTAAGPEPAQLQRDTLEWLRAVTEQEPTWLGVELSAALNDHLAKFKRLDGVQQSGTDWAAYGTSEGIQTLAGDLRHALESMEQLRQETVNGLSGSDLPSPMLVFFLSLAAILVVLLLENLFAGAIRNNLLRLKDTLLELTQSRLAPGGRLSLQLGGWAGVLYPLPKIGHLLNNCIEIHEEVIGQIGASVENCEQAARVIENCHREIHEGARAQAGAADETSASSIQMTATLQGVVSSVQDLSRSTETSSKSIQEMDRSMHRISEGSGELHALIQQSNGSINDMVLSIGQIRNSLSSLSHSVASTSSTVSEINASVKSVGQHAKESTALARQSTQVTSEKGVRAVGRTLEGMQRIRETVDDTDRLVKSLDKRSEEIGEILNVIDEIAEKTNLLALNASIIASQAGTHGRAFTVVANEIKALAEKTSASIGQIEQVIENAQTETRAVSRSIQQGVQQVQEGMDRSLETKKALQAILTSSKQASEMTERIETTTIEQIHAIDRVTGEIQNINERVQQITASAAEHDKGGAVILEMIARLSEFAENLKRSMAEESQGSQRVSQEIENIFLKIREINKAVEEHRGGNELIARAIERIRIVTEEKMNLADDMRTAIVTLSGYNSNLQEQVQHAAAATDTETLTLGVLPIESGNKMQVRFAPLARYLQEALGKRVQLRVAADFESAIHDLGRGITDIACLSPSTYIESRRRHGTEVILKAVRNHAPYYRSVIAAREGSPIQSLADLRGKRFGFGDVHSTSGHLMPKKMLAREGIGLQDLGGHTFLQHHDSVAWAIINGDVDAGGLLEPIAQRFLSKGLRIVATSTNIPEFNFCVRAGMAPDLKRRVTRALLTLDAQDAEQRNIIKSIEYEYNGFIMATEEDYSVIEELVYPTAPKAV